MQLFLSLPHPHYPRLLQTHSQSMSAEHIFHSINCSLTSASPSASTARSFAFTSFRSMFFLPMFPLISSTTAINNNELKGSPVRHSRSTQHPTIRVLKPPRHYPDIRLWDSPRCCHRHSSRDYIIGLLQVCEPNCHILLHFLFLSTKLPHGKPPISCSSSFTKLLLFFTDLLLLLFCHPGFFLATSTYGLAT